MKLITDVDDVALDWMGGFRTFLQSKGVKLKKERPTKWDLNDWIDHHDVTGLVIEFNHSDAFGRLRPIKGAVKALQSLHQKGVGLWAITSCTDQEEAVRLRKYNLKRCFGDIFTDVVCLPLGMPKHDHLKKHEPGAYWVDDKFANALAGHEAGHRSMIFERDHNREDPAHPDIPRMRGWKEVYDHIERETRSLQRR